MRLDLFFRLLFDKSEMKKNGQILDLLGFAAGKNVLEMVTYLSLTRNHMV